MYSAQNLTVTSAAGVASELEKLAYYGLCAFVLVLPWGGDTRTLAGVVLASWIFMLPVGLMALRVFTVKAFRLPCRLHYLLLAFVAWVAASLLWTVDTESTMTRLGTYLQLSVFVLLIWELATTEERVQGLIVSYVVGAEIASVLTIYNYATGRSAGDTGIDSGRYSADGVNADELGLIIALSIPMALYLLSANKNWLLKALCWVQVVVGLTAILLSGTRGALFAVIPGLVIISGPTLSRMSWKQRVVAILACIAFVVCAAHLVPQSTIDRLLATGTELTQGTLTHRTVIWAAGLEVFRDHAFLGVGAGAYAPAIVRIIDVPFFAHNTFLSVLVELGVVGAGLLALLLGSMLSYTFRMRFLEKFLWLALLATWAVGVSSVTWENRKTTWFLFGLVAAQAYAVRTRPHGFRHSVQPPVYRMPVENYAVRQTSLAP